MRSCNRCGPLCQNSKRSGEAPSRHTEQYAEMTGHRGFYRDGWKLLALHEPGRGIDEHRQPPDREQRQEQPAVVLAQVLDPGAVAHVVMIQMADVTD